ncbi:MAG: acyltransferase [Anaerolineales bacterium]|nr:acyltransferase [Anaerolineales bacterium]
MIQADKTKKLSEFEILRAASIILLMFSHSDIYSLTLYGIKLEPIGPYLRGFFLGSFFFMAGYFIEHSNKNKQKDFLMFIWSKIVRLFPPYWLALLSFMFIMYYSLQRDDLIVYSLNLQFLFSPLYVKQLLTLWYISVVFSYFVIFGLFLSSSTRNLLIWSVFVFVGSYLINRQYGLFDYRFFEYYLIFLLGILLARFEDVYEKLIKISLPVQLLLVFIGFVMFGIFCFGDYKVTSWAYILASDFHIITMIVLALKIFRTGYLDHKIWNAISYSSFFAYLFHRPIWEIMFRMIEFPFRIYDGWYRLFPGAILVFVICYYFQLGYDKTLDAAETLWKRNFNMAKENM